MNTSTMKCNCLRKCCVERCTNQRKKAKMQNQAAKRDYYLTKTLHNTQEDSCIRHNQFLISATQQATTELIQKLSLLIAAKNSAAVGK